MSNIKKLWFKCWLFFRWLYFDLSGKEASISTVKKLQRKAERLWKQVVLLRDGKECQVKKKFPYIKTSHTDTYQVDHCFSRRYKRTFLEIANGTVVCSACNRNKQYNDTINLAIHEIRQAEEGEVYDRLRSEIEQGGAFIKWRNIGWLEEKIKTLEELREFYENQDEAIPSWGWTD